MARSYLSHMADRVGTFNFVLSVYTQVYTYLIEQRRLRSRVIFEGKTTKRHSKGVGDALKSRDTAFLHKEVFATSHATVELLEKSCTKCQRGRAVYFKIVKIHYQSFRYINQRCTNCFNVKFRTKYYQTKYFCECSINKITHIFSIF